MKPTFFDANFFLFVVLSFLICFLLSSCNEDFKKKYEQEKQEKKALIAQIEILKMQLLQAQKETKLHKRKGPKEPVIIDLIQLIKKLTSQRSWWLATEKNSPVIWNHSGLIDGDNGFAFKREGKALVSLHGKLIEVLEQSKTPLFWDVKLYGPKAGVLKVKITPNRTLEELVDYQLVADIKKKGGKYKLLRCDPYNSASAHEWLFEYHFATHQKAYLFEVMSCGSAGCNLEMQLYSTLEDAESDLAKRGEKLVTQCEKAQI